MHGDCLALDSWHSAALRCYARLGALQHCGCRCGGATARLAETWCMPALFAVRCDAAARHLRRNCVKSVSRRFQLSEWQDTKSKPVRALSRLGARRGSQRCCAHPPRCAVRHRPRRPPRRSCRVRLALPLGPDNGLLARRRRVLPRCHRTTARRAPAAADANRAPPRSCRRRQRRRRRPSLSSLWSRDCLSQRWMTPRPATLAVSWRTYHSCRRGALLRSSATRVLAHRPSATARSPNALVPRACARAATRLRSPCRPP